jgi:phage gp46-like protein
MAVTVYRITDEGFARVTDNGLDLRYVTSYTGLVDLPGLIASTGRGDIASTWQVDLAQADWEMAGPILRSGMDLHTATLISLFTDRLAAADDSLPDGTNDRRGWWGDKGETVPIGSRLWLLDRAKLTNATALACKNYITEALQWLLDDGVAAAINVTTAVQLPSMLAAKVEVFRQDGTRISNNFAWVWQG